MDNFGQIFPHTPQPPAGKCLCVTGVPCPQILRNQKNPAYQASVVWPLIPDHRCAERQVLMIVFVLPVTDPN